MALKPCSECGRQVSTHAFTCPECGAPVEAAPASPPMAARPHPPAPALAPAPGRRLLVAGGIVMVLLGAGADATLRHRAAGPGATPAVANGSGASDAVPPPGAGSGLGQRLRALFAWVPGIGRGSAAGTAQGTLGGAAVVRRAEIDMRLVLQEVARQQQRQYQARGVFAPSLDLLEVTLPPGVHLSLTAGDQAWSAQATNDRAPGTTCTIGGSVGQRDPTEVTCGAPGR